MMAMGMTRLGALAGLSALLMAPVRAQPDSAATASAVQPSTDAVLVQAGRLSLRAFDTPGAVHSVDGEAIAAAGPQVNLSEALGAVPSIVALNRQNYAQDLQISLRGFGARAAFGLRGIRLLTDGITASTPDGQGQSSTVALTSTERIEVLTGPLRSSMGMPRAG